MFTLLFTGEILAKFFGFGLVARTPSGQLKLGLFWSDGHNIVELVVRAFIPRAARSHTLGMELRPSISRSQVLALCWASVVFFNTYCVDFKYAYPEKSKKQYLAYSHFLRSLRSFRLIGYVPQLQSMMHAFAFAISSVFWVITLVLLFLYIAAVIATDFLGGQSRACDELGGGGEADDANLDEMCAVSKNYRFGTVLQSMSVLFNVLTLDGWLDLVQDLSAGSYAPTWWSSTPFNTSVWSFLVRGELKGGGRGVLASCVS